MRRLLALLALGALAAAPAGGHRVEAAAAAPAPRAACPPSPFTSGFDAALRSRWPGQRFSASVHDRRTGCTYDYRPDLRMTTASVLKAEILAGLLLRAQSEGRGLTKWERDRVGPMIARSADPEANALWSSLGGIAGMQRVSAAFGLTETTQRSPWGITTTSARDRTRLMRLLVNGDGGPLGASYRATARSYLLSVVPSQRWGITAGAPPGRRVPLKNGFFSSRCCRWRLNSSGVIEVPGGGYVVTILTDRWSGEAAGIEGNEFVARAINARLGGPFTPFASPAAFTDRQYRDVLGRSPSFAELSRATFTVGFSTWRAPVVIESLLGLSAFHARAHPLLRIYLGALGRMPTGPQFSYRMHQLRTGAASLRSIAEDASHSRDLTGGAALSDGEFVDRLVMQVLGRPPDAEGRAYWVGRLARGDTSRGEVIRAYVESPESRWVRAHPVMVGSVFHTMLDRAPEPAVVADWQGRLAGGSSLRELVAMVYRSSEYRARVG